MMEAKLEQPENVRAPIEVRESGRVIEVKLEQRRNAPSLSEVTEEGIMIDVKLVQNPKFDMTFAPS